MANYSPNQTTWLNPDIDYLFGDEISEWDIQDAGFNLIKEFKLLPEDEIYKLEHIEKGLKRHIEIGKMQGKDKVLSEGLSKAFQEARFHFVNTNHLSGNDIVSVKKDAFFTTGSVTRTKFGHVVFRRKNTYTSYLRFPNIHNIEIYYSDTNMDFKQINDHCVARHRIYMVEFLKEYIRRMETRDPSVKRFLMNFIQKYKSLEMDEEYYLEFNNKSLDINPLFNYKEILLPLVMIVHKEII